MSTSKVQIRTSPLWAWGLAALFVSLVGTHASAATGMEPLPSVKVTYDTRDLATPEGSAKVYRKIKGAARRVCFEASEVWDGARRAHYYRCYEAALAKAVDDVNSKNLTALHQQNSANKKRPS